MNTNPNDLAYPIMAQHYLHKGLTKREYFAAMAMQGMLARAFDMPGEDVEDTCESAVEYADFLIKKLNKQV